MAAARKFTFGSDFREGARQSLDQGDVEAARRDGFLAGQAQGRAEAQNEFTMLLSRLAQAAERLLSAESARQEQIEAEAAHVAVATAQAMARAALAEKPLGAIERGARECLVHARLAPHLALRVNAASVEAVEQLMARLQRETGFGGKVVVLGEPDIAEGDGRIEWAEGGYAIEQAKLGMLVDEAVNALFARPAGL